MSELMPIKDESGVYNIYNFAGECVGQVDSESGRALIGRRFYAVEGASVRCENCVHCQSVRGVGLICTRMSFRFKVERGDYCSWGERCDSDDGHEDA